MRTPPDDQAVCGLLERVLADCGGDKDLALYALAAALAAAWGRVSGGYVRLPPAARR